jgi:hypothetical protein
LLSSAIKAVAFDEEAATITFIEVRDGALRVLSWGVDGAFGERTAGGP